MTLHRVERATQQGLAFLARAQRTDGGFDSYSSQTLARFNPEQTYQTTFTPALILSAISKLQAAQRVRQKLAPWLLAQKSPNWSFNYWAVDANERASMPYPDDLDDTFCALIALYQHDPSLIDETCLALVVKLLVATESAIGGPYHTWLVAKDAPAVWQDIDLAVNSNIANFLSLVAEPLPNLTKLIEQAIHAQTFTSPYYPSAYPILYYMARAYRGADAQQLAQYLIDRQRHGAWETPLPTALAISSLTRLGQSTVCKPAIDQLLDWQLADGSWPAEAFCLDPALEGRPCYCGSAALTTALALEALHEYQQTIHTAPRQQRTIRVADSSLLNHVKQMALELCEQLPPALRQPSKQTLQATFERTDSDEIVLLPQLFNQSLTKPLAAARHRQTLTHLCLANLFGWMAYTIYDDFLDDEGQPRLLSVANAALRRSLEQFATALPSDEAFAQTVSQTFDCIDGANAWELAHCRMPATSSVITLGKLPRYPNTLQLADRSLGHTLTPLGVLAAASVVVTDKRASLVQQALRHYIAARQLNDDLHDWEQDLRAGRISFVVAAILRDLEARPGKHPFRTLVPKMQRQFWHDTLPKICRLITNHTAQARQAARASQLLQPSNSITKLADAIDASVEHTLHEHAKAETFLTAYKQ